MLSKTSAIVRSPYSPQPVLSELRRTIPVSRVARQIAWSMALRTCGRGSISPTKGDDIKLSLGELIADYKNHGHDEAIKVTTRFNGSVLVFTIEARSHIEFEDDISRALMTAQFRRPELYCEAGRGLFELWAITDLKPTLSNGILTFGFFV